MVTNQHNRLSTLVIAAITLVYLFEVPGPTVFGLEFWLACLTYRSVHVHLPRVSTLEQTTISNSLSNLWCGEVVIGGLNGTESRTFEMAVKLRR